MLDASASGVYVIAPTPFHDDGRIDERSTDRMTDFFLESGVTGITVLGQMGEAPKLDHDEAVGVAARVIRRARRAGDRRRLGAGLCGHARARARGHGGGRRRRHDRAAADAAHRRPDRRPTIARPPRRSAPDVPFVIQDYPLTFSRRDDAGGDPPHRRRRTRPA